jgi:hypothetical protein
MDKVLAEESVQLSATHTEDFTVVGSGTEWLEYGFDKRKYCYNLVVSPVPGEVDADDILSVSWAKRDVVFGNHSAFGNLDQVFEVVADLE